LLYTFTYAEYPTSATITFQDKLLKGNQDDSVIHHSKKFIALKTMVHINQTLLQTLYTKFTIKHPSGWFLVYSYRLPYGPTTRADHPHGSLVPPKGSGPPVPGWSRPQASTTHLLQSTPPTPPWPTCLILADRGELMSRRDLYRRLPSTIGPAG